MGGNSEALIKTNRGEGERRYEVMNRTGVMDRPFGLIFFPLWCRSVVKNNVRVIYES